MLHRTAQERYEKLKKEFRRLMKRFNRDDLDDFIQTANSLRKWIRHDTTLTIEQRTHLERFVVPESLDWQICNQIANMQKHVNTKPRSKRQKSAGSIPVVSAVQVSPGGTGFMEQSSRLIIGAGDDIVIECDGKSESALAFVFRTFNHFHYIFEMAPIAPNERRIPTLMELVGGKE